jgi:protoporphyrinogen oxidase
MCEPYTTKIWKGNPALLSADWADQRFQGVNLSKLVKRVFYKLIQFDFSSYSLEDERLAPDGGEFYYPEKGIQQVSDRYVECITTHGGTVITSSEVFKVNSLSSTVSYHNHSDEVVKIKYRKGLISTIPLHALYAALGDKNTQVEQNLKELNYMNIIFVYLFINKEKISSDHWLYFPDGDIVFNRSVEFKTWSSKMAPIDKTALCLDITCFAKDSLWTATDAELTKLCITGAEKVNLVQPGDVYDSLVIRVKNAYPYYDLDYKHKLKNIVNHCEQSGNIYCLGRTGIFKYNNSDGSIEMAIELADQLSTRQSDTGKLSLLDYNFRHISY